MSRECGEQESGLRVFDVQRSRHELNQRRRNEYAGRKPGGPGGRPAADDLNQEQNDQPEQGEIEQARRQGTAEHVGDGKGEVSGQGINDQRKREGL